MIGQDNTIRTYIVAGALCLCAVFGMPKTAQAATMTVDIAQQALYVGDTASVDWFVDTHGESINAVDVDISYDPNTLDVVQLSTGSSAATIWAENPTVIKPGIIHLVAGFPAGIAGSHIPLLTTVYRATHTGSSFFSITPTASNVFLNNGFGTAEGASMSPVSFSILPAGSKLMVISSPTDPVESVWYAAHDVSIHFVPQPGVAYSYSFSSNQEIVPGDMPIQTTGDISYDAVPDGVYYFKLAIQNGTGWQEAGVYRVQIDSTSPSIVSDTIASSPDIFAGKPFVSFSALDKVSGIASYSVQSGFFGFYHQAQTPYQFSRPLIGNFITLRATDLAGNSSTVRIPCKAYVPTWLGIVLLLVCAMMFALRYTSLHRILRVIKK